jgi:hypothetical protein
MVGAGRFERPTPCAQGIGCPHLGINRFNNLRTLLVGPCGNFSYNLDCKAAIRLVKPPTTPTGSPAGSADCEINQRGRAYVVTAGSLEGPSIAGFKLGDPLLLRQVVWGRISDAERGHSGSFASARLAATAIVLATAPHRSDDPSHFTSVTCTFSVRLLWPPVMGPTRSKSSPPSGVSGQK